MILFYYLSWYYVSIILSLVVVVLWFFTTALGSQPLTHLTLLGIAPAQGNFHVPFPYMKTWFKADMSGAPLPAL